MRIKVRARGLAKDPLSPSYPFGISQTLDMCVAKVINSLGVRFHLHMCYIHLCVPFQLMETDEPYHLKIHSVIFLIYRQPP